MEILEGIFTRRSIRKYTNQEISTDQIQLLIKQMQKSLMEKIQLEFKNIKRKKSK